jgi:hypothetical protein
MAAKKLDFEALVFDLGGVLVGQAALGCFLAKAERSDGR